MSITSKHLIVVFLTAAACQMTPEEPTDIDWDYIFPGDEFAEYCETEIEEDCLYYPPYYY